MRKIISSSSAGLLGLVFIFGMIASTSTTAHAQWRTRDNGYNNQQVQQGFQYGVNVGAADAQGRQSYSPQRSHYYRDAPNQAFREGFTRGYDQGYRQYAGAYGNGGYRNDGSYGNGGYRNGGYDNQQINAGYQQGVNTGASDGRSNKGYSPERSRYYRNASTQAYREGFVRGYDEGYRQYAGNRSYRRSNTAATILEQIFRRP
jgi:hypothetical protein